MSRTAATIRRISTLDDLKHLHETLGVDRVVFTQPSTYGTDNSAILDGMTALNAETPNRARCVVAITMDITDKELAALDERGARGVRLNTDNKGGMPIGFDQIGELEARIQPFGWHIEWLFPGKDIVELMPVFKKLKVPMSIGHFAYQPATAGVDGARLPGAARTHAAGNTWMKISGANRVSETDLPPYDDVKPMAHALIEAAPERIMWGTDWPHPNKYVVNPNDGDLVDAFGDWVTDEAMRQQDHGRHAGGVLPVLTGAAAALLVRAVVFGCGFFRDESFRDVVDERSAVAPAADRRSRRRRRSAEGSARRPRSRTAPKPASRIPAPSRMRTTKRLAAPGLPPATPLGGNRARS